MKIGITLKSLRKQLLLNSQEIADWATPEKQQAMEQYRYDYEYTNGPCRVKGWKNIDEMEVDLRGAMSELRRIQKLLKGYVKNADAIPSGAWNNFGRG
jgi:hypothetical protein